MSLRGDVRPHLCEKLLELVPGEAYLPRGWPCRALCRTQKRVIQQVLQYIAHVLPGFSNARTANRLPDTNMLCNSDHSAEQFEAHPSFLHNNKCSLHIDNVPFVAQTA